MDTESPSLSPAVIPGAGLPLRDTRPVLSIVVPAHNESENLPALVAEIEAACAAIGPIEIVIVDDASTDSTPEVLDALALRHPSLRRRRLASRSGQSVATLAGLQRARGRLVATIDADLQNDPRDIPALLALLGEADIAQGYRRVRRDRWSRRAASGIANGIRRAMLGDHVRDIGCSLRVMRAECVRGLPPFRGVHRFLPAILEFEGFRLVQAPVEHRPRAAGRTHYGNSRRAIQGTLDLFGVLWFRARAFRQEVFRDA